MPIYCAYDSCDVWSHPEYFEVDDCYRQIHVAGCPPDAFTEDGQLWGNPLYRYDVMKKTAILGGSNESIKWVNYLMS